MIVAGIGCTTLCPAADIVAAIRMAAAQSGATVTVVAAPRFKSGHAALRAAARELGLDIVLIDDGALRAVQPDCPTHSEAALRSTGLGSVAEAAALAAAGPQARLILARLIHGGATCALAAAA